MKFNNNIKIDFSLKTKLNKYFVKSILEILTF